MKTPELWKRRGGEDERKLSEGGGEGHLERKERRHEERGIRSW